MCVCVYVSMYVSMYVCVCVYMFVATSSCLTLCLPHGNNQPLLVRLDHVMDDIENLLLMYLMYHFLHSTHHLPYLDTVADLPLTSHHL